MRDEITVRGVQYVSARDAAKNAGLTRDHVTRLCKEGRLACAQEGRWWYIDPASLEQYAQKQEQEKEARNHKLSQMRKAEYRLRATPPVTERCTPSIAAEGGDIQEPRLAPSSVVQSPQDHDEIFFSGTRYISLHSAAELIGVDSSELANLCAQGFIPSKKVGSRYYIAQNALPKLVREVAETDEPYPIQKSAPRHTSARASSEIPTAVATTTRTSHTPVVALLCTLVIAAGGTLAFTTGNIQTHVDRTLARATDGLQLVHRTFPEARIARDASVRKMHMAKSLFDQSIVSIEGITHTAFSAVESYALAASVRLDAMLKPSADDENAGVFDQSFSQTDAFGLRDRAYRFVIAAQRGVRSGFVALSAPYKSLGAQVHIEPGFAREIRAGEWKSLSITSYFTEGLRTLNTGGQLAAAAGEDLTFLEKIVRYFFGVESNEVEYVPTQWEKTIVQEKPIATKTIAESPRSISPAAVAQAIVNYPIVERIREVRETIVSEGVSQAVFDAHIADMKTYVQQQLRGLSSGSGGNTYINNVYNQIAQSNRIDQLASVNISGSAWSGGTISSADISGATISGSSFSGGTFTGTPTFVGFISSASTTISDLSVTRATTTYATSTYLTIFNAPEAPAFTATSSTATSTFAGGILGTRAPTIPHTFSTWTTGAANANPLNAALVVNPASSVADGNLISASVNNSVKFLVDAEGDVFTNSLTSVGSVTLSNTTASTFSVEGNTTLGDSISDTTTINGTLTVSGTTTVSSVAGNFGAGSTTPWAKLSVHARHGDTNSMLFAVASSTASATTTFFTISNTGAIAATGAITSNATGANTFPYASSTALTVSGTGYFGTASTTNLTVSSLTATRIPYVTTAGAFTDSSLLTFDGTRINFTYASSTALTVSGTGYFGTASTTNLTISGAPSGVIVTNSSGVASASSTLAVNVGGTGATTLTGLLQGNGTGAITGITGTTGQLPYYNGTNTLLATSSLFISTASNVGIGTTTPLAKTFVEGAGLIVKGSLSSTANLVNYGSTGSIGLDTTSNLGRIWTDASSALSFNPGAAEAMRITSAGLVGIGTTTPVIKLTAYGSGNVGIFGDNTSAVAFGNSSSVAMIQSLTNTSAGGASNLTINPSGGNVGIGTTTPWALLSVNPNGISGPSFAIGSSTATHFLVTNGGNVGIGTTTPSTSLHIAGTNSGSFISASVDNAATAANSYESFHFRSSGVLKGFIGYENNASRLDFGNGASPNMSITSGGNVGIGTASPTTGKLQVSNSNASYSGVAIANSVGTNSLFIDHTGASQAVVIQSSAGPNYPLNILATNESFTGIANMNQVYAAGAGTWYFTYGQSDSNGTPDAEYYITGAGNGALDGTWSSPADYAEWTRVTGSPAEYEVGDIVSFSSTDRRAQKATKGDSVLGAITLKPGIVGVSYDISMDVTDANTFSTTTLAARTQVEMEQAYNAKMVALLGYTPLHVSTENGPIKNGDYITMSSIPGVGMKANPGDPVVGYAFESFDPENGKLGTNDVDLPTYDESTTFRPQTTQTATPEGQSVYVGWIFAHVDKGIAATHSSQLISGLLLLGASTTPEVAAGSFLDNFFNNLFEKLRLWFASAANGIGEVFARVFNASEKICVDGECLTRDDIRTLKQLAAAGASGSTGQQSGGGSNQESGSGNGADSSQDTEAPVITINGNNPATIDLGDSYNDLGATVSDNKDNNIGIKASVNGGEPVEIGSIVLDTTTPGEHKIVYSATDQAGNVGSATRTVIVLDPNPPLPESSDAPAEE